MNKNLVGGSWVEGSAVVADLNPSDTSDCIGDFASADRDQTNEAIAAAREAAVTWGKGGIQQRAEALDLIGEQILSRKNELGTLLSREEGKILAEGIGEVVRAGQIFKFFAGEAVRIAGASIDSVRPGVGVEVTAEPIGVIGIITPWNFPIAIPAWKIAPALAFGNTVVFKPAGLVPASAQALTQIIADSGLPDGVFNLVMGSGQEVGATIVESPAVDHALKPETQMGPVVDDSQLEQDLAYIDVGRKEGAEVVTGGARLERDTDGYYLGPTLFAETDNAMRINREEIFGPIAAVIRVLDYEEALHVANDTEFGLSAGICTTSLKHASHFKRHSDAGMVMINLPTAGVDYHVPFGGRGHSSFGSREQGQAAVQFYTTTKTAYVNP